MDITKKFKEIDNKSIKLQYKVTAKVYNLNGHGLKREQLITKQAYSETTTEVKDQHIEGSALHRSSEKAIGIGSKKREHLESVSTFPTNGNGRLLAPLGGAYGYIMGAMKTSVARKFGTTSKKTNPAYGAKSNLAIGTSVEPEWIEIAAKCSNPLDQPMEYWIKEAKQPIYFDYVKESDLFTFAINIESELSEDILLHLLAFIQRVGLGPKRRGIMKIEKIERVEA